MDDKYELYLNDLASSEGMPDPPPLEPAEQSAPALAPRSDDVPFQDA
jgi:hypothetical protein